MSRLGVQSQPQGTFLIMFAQAEDHAEPRIGKHTCKW
jgi:hypothetical protein